LGAFEERHHSGSAFACAETAGKEPVVFANRNWTVLPLEMIFIHRQIAL
jgi:hypothetical protein